MSGPPSPLHRWPTLPRARILPQLPRAHHPAFPDIARWLACTHSQHSLLIPALYHSDSPTDSGGVKEDKKQKMGVGAHAHYVNTNPM